MSQFSGGDFGSDDCVSTVPRTHNPVAGIERLDQRQATCITLPDTLPPGAPAFGVRRLVAAFGHELQGRLRRSRSDSANKLAHSKRWRAAIGFLSQTETLTDSSARHIRPRSGAV